MGLLRRTAVPLLFFSALVLATTNEDASDGEDEAHHPMKSFLLSISMIGVSEIGDKTFLIAALMAMRYTRLLVFSASATALFIMTILSGIVGRTFTSMVPQRYTQFMAGILFLVFGYKLTLEGLAMPKDMGVEEELAEVEEEIAVKDINKNNNQAESGGSQAMDMTKNPLKKYPFLNRFFTKATELSAFIFTPVWIQIFTMVFLGEFGDRSQISTIAMASGSDYWSVIWGAIVGHAICTGIAVVGGKMLASKISMRTVTLGGAFSFFIFAVLYVREAFLNPN
ncbi:LANO_0E08548g1_1 [Lachancea nothofagi CBS 11611]|uniref:GDT1 family protein n=1 Tax=Lachancea nothofagi CBS 11611 TaxID=1266666 RepID=A0A1G4JVE3_9SACH|nr:LANO_0E08548g1_1 [Lachancea nothofagi CBS 11611]